MRGFFCLPYIGKVSNKRLSRKITEYMNTKKYFFLICSICFVNFVYAQSGSRLSTTVTPTNEFIVVIDHNLHQQYGCLYPMTYQMDIPHGSSGLQVQRKYTSSDLWETIEEKTSQDLFNAIEAVRFDYSNDKAYISTPFSAASDSLFIRISDSQSNPITLLYRGLSKYYDNRVAAVTITADDWCNLWVNANYGNGNYFGTLLDIFRSYKLYVTVGIITDWCSDTTWNLLQNQLDSGYIEAASHSRTHTCTSYSDVNGEVQGSYDDIMDHLALPDLFSSDSLQYVYVWIAPCGYYDSMIDAALGYQSYLIPRLYSVGDSSIPSTTFSKWEDMVGHFGVINPTVEIDAPSEGQGDTSLTSLNSKFDSVITQNGIYHFMWHPWALFPDRDASYFRDHLNYISNRTNIWYVALGHLYLYHLLQDIHITFTDGNGFTPSITPNNTNQVLGRFQLSADISGASLTNVSIQIRGTRTGLSNLKLWSSSDSSFGVGTQLGSTVASDSGDGHSVSFGNFSSALSTSGTYFFLTGDVAAGATGNIQCMIIQNSSLTLNNGVLSGTITNASLSNDDSPLPVELSAFTVSIVQEKAVLQWKTSSENNNYGFEVERRTISNRQITPSSIDNWQKIGFVQGSGTSSSPKEYSFTDTKLAAGIYVYRLKQVNHDGTYKYSSEVEVTLSVPKVFTLSQNYPNPFNPTTTIEFTIAADGLTTLKVFDLLGREVQTLVDQNLKAGEQYSVVFDASKLSCGLYFYRLNCGKSSLVKKLVLVK